MTDDIRDREDKALELAHAAMPPAEFKYVHTQREKDFARIWAETDSRVQAYVGAGYPDTDNVEGRAAALSRTGAIRELADYHKQALAYRANITASQVIGELKDAIELDPADFFRADGSMKNIHEIPEHARKWISEVQSEQSLKGVKTKVKWINKLAVFKELKEIANLSKEHQQAGADQINIHFADLREPTKVEGTVIDG